MAGRATQVEWKEVLTHHTQESCRFHAGDPLAEAVPGG